MAVTLIAATAVLIGLALYLFVQVRSAPAQTGTPTVSRETPSPPPSPPPPATRDSATPPSTATPPPSAPDTRVRVGNDVVTPQAMAGSDDQRANPKLESLMELANKAYDRQEFDDARLIADKVLSKEPTNVRMLRIMVSSNCIQGDTAVAQQYYDKLPKFDREQMKTRCDRYGVTFKEPSQ